jgi:hypothetical protein
MLEATTSKNLTRPDNVFCTDDLLESLIRCEVRMEDRPGATDHFPIVMIFDTSVHRVKDRTRYNFREVDWAEFDAKLKSKLEEQETGGRITKEGELEQRVERLTEVILQTIREEVKTTKPSPYSKQWWTTELKKEKALTCKLGRLAWVHRGEPENQIHGRYRQQRNRYKEEIKRTKAAHWAEWLEEADEKSVWIANKVVTGQIYGGATTKVPALKRSNNNRQEASGDNAVKAHIFKESFFPVPDASAVPAEDDYPEPAFHFQSVTSQQVHKVLARTNAYKAPGPSGIPNILLKQCANTLVPCLLPIYNVLLNLGHGPAKWKLSSTIVLRKPGKPDYSLAKVYRPIVLLETMSKVLSSCVADSMQYHTEKQKLLPNTHFGGRPGRTAIDAPQLMTTFIKDSWRRGEVTTALFLVSKGRSQV